MAALAGAADRAELLLHRGLVAGRHGLDQLGAFSFESLSLGAEIGPIGPDGGLGLGFSLVRTSREKGRDLLGESIERLSRSGRAGKIATVLKDLLDGAEALLGGLEAFLANLQRVLGGMDTGRKKSAAGNQGTRNEGRSKQTNLSHSDIFRL